MTKQFDLLIDGPGIVFFDPYVVAAFLSKRKLATTDLFQLFLDDPTLGDEVITQGIILPIYPIPPIDYQVIINNTSTSSIRPSWLRLTSPPLPLTVGQQGKLVAADMYALMEWDTNFYQAVTDPGCLAPQAATALHPGQYKALINGFVEQEYEGRGPKNIGYELLLERVETLPLLPPAFESDSIDFALWHPA